MQKRAKGRVTMTRREFLQSLIVSFVLATPLVAHAQQAGKVYRIGYVSSASPQPAQPGLSAFRQALRDLGWIEGQNVIIETRYTMGDNQQHAALIAEVLRLKVDVIVTTSTPGALAAKAATQETPIVFSMVSDPVATGVVTNLSRPGGNLTGWSNMLPVTTRKLLELLKEVSPTVSRVAVLFDPGNPGKLLEVKALQEDAGSTGLALDPLEVRNLADITAAFASMAQKRTDGLVTLQDAVTGNHRKEIVELAAKARIPAIYQTSEFVAAGGLMSYGMNMVAQYRRSAMYVDKIFRGAKPGNLPVEQPMMFEMVVNPRAAKALGVTIPQSILLRADRVIE
jgi:putative ABC transport system substrate-binding protein